MIRFANPSSSVDSLIRSYLFLYENIDRNVAFGLHDMQEILVVNGLISSSGAMGADALLKGSNKDLSRDKSYNQCKMIAELFRLFGWIQSTESALTYCFTPLGDHLAHASKNRRRLIGKCFLGIEFPNDLITGIGHHRLRPFLTILRTMKDMNGVLARDEMIIGPLSMKNDRDQEEYQEMIERLGKLRKNKENFDKHLSKALGERGIAATTAGNYTRFPLGALKWLKWAESGRDSKNFDKATHAYSLTETGRLVLGQCEYKLDIRLSDLKPMSKSTLEGVCKYIFFKDLAECDFDISDVAGEYRKAKEKVIESLGSEEFLFSPFQALDSHELSEIFNYRIPKSKRESLYGVEHAGDRRLAPKLIDLVRPKRAALTGQDTKLWKIIEEMKTQSSDDIAMERIKAEYRDAGKEEYYPFIEDLMKCLGFQCELSPHGVNSRRWDAIILSEADSIPIEIKSPGEEVHISVKAVRQALENKVILQSRETFENKPDTCSMAIGYELPNNRSEVDGLIEDIKSIYGISIAVLGIDSLLMLAFECFEEGKVVDIEEFASMSGVIGE